MSTGQLLVLVAIIVTYLMWRRVRRENQRLRAANETLLEQRTYNLEPASDDGGSGYHVHDGAGRRVDASALQWERDGLAVVTLHQVGAGARPGQQVQLVPTGEGPVEVLREDDTLLGTLGGAEAALVDAAMERQELTDAIVLWHDTNGSVTLLLVHAAIMLEP